MPITFNQSRLPNSLLKQNLSLLDFACLHIKHLVLLILKATHYQIPTVIRLPQSHRHTALYPTGMMVAKREGPTEIHSGVKKTHSRTGSNKRAHTFASLLRAVSMIQESTSSRPLALTSAQDVPSIPLLSSPELTSGRSASTASTFSVITTTTISNPTPYDSKLWVDKHLGSHAVLSEFSTCTPPNVARASPDMLHALPPTQAVSVDRPQQHQQAQQQQDRPAYAATTPSETFSHHTPSLLRNPSRATTLPTSCKILLSFSPLPRMGRRSGQKGPGHMIPFIIRPARYKRRAPLIDISKLTADEQERWKRARARQYSASARQRQIDREQDLRDLVEIWSVFQILVEAAPNAVLLLSPDGQARILFANDQCGHLLRLDSARLKGQALVGRSLWEWMDAQDKAAVVAAIGVCLFCKDATRQVYCTFYSPRSPFALQPGGAMQQQGNQEPQQYQQPLQRQQDAIRADLMFRSNERGLVVFMRPDKTRGKGM